MTETVSVITFNDCVMIWNDHWSRYDDDEVDEDQLVIKNDPFLTDPDHFILKMIVIWLKRFCSSIKWLCYDW
jgi:hypothetical protein